jgi:hypothetical protein
MFFYLIHIDFYSLTVTFVKGIVKGYKCTKYPNKVLFFALIL